MSKPPPNSFQSCASCFGVIILAPIVAGICYVVFKMIMSQL